MKQRKPSWGEDIVRVEEMSMADVLTIDGDVWVDRMREELGLPTSTPPRQVRVEDPTRPFSSVKKPVEVVWEICNKMPAASRDAQIAACVAAGVNVHTARTQQSKWANRFKPKS